MINDRTAQFKELVNSYHSQNNYKKSESKRFRAYSSSSDDSDDQKAFSKMYMKEAYSILNHIVDLNHMLVKSKRAYLLSDDDVYSNKSYSNEEREEIDIQSRKIIRQCANRVQALELLEKRRAQTASNSDSRIFKWLGPTISQGLSDVALANIAVHHSSITYYLNRRLAEVSQKQKELQEERIRRHIERAKSLGSSTAQDLSRLTNDISAIPVQSKAESSNWFSNMSYRDTSNRPAEIPSTFEDQPDVDEDVQLSEAQLLQFETENSHIMQSLQDMRMSIEEAESRLMDISALQMELVTHLTRQNEMTNQLYADAIESTITFEKGNLQLKSAKRKMGDGRLYILLFLIGSSFALLFLHYY